MTTDKDVAWDQVFEKLKERGIVDNPWIMLKEWSEVFEELHELRGRYQVLLKAIEEKEQIIQRVIEVFADKGNSGIGVA